MGRTDLSVLGGTRVQKNLSKAVREIKGNTRAGIQAGAIFMRDGSSALAPVDEGVLRNSKFMKVIKTDERIIAVVGFTAKYAAAVHEKNMTMKGVPRKGKDAKGNYWDGGENKFLEKFVVRNTTRLVRIIERFAKKTPK